MELLKRAVLPAAAGWLAIDLYMSAAVAARGIAPLRLFQWDASNVLGGAAAVVMFVMLWVVVPLGLARQGAMTWTNFAIVLVGHTLFFGVPLAVVAGKSTAWLPRGSPLFRGQR